ncbi:MAG: polysaccharide deacetylase family protein [Methanomethylovorans sp.]|nr:polysaccharide deacetylase family protein [Methanomethylovorans sp.]
MKKITITIDVEQDCPPFLNTMHGIEKGLPRLMELFMNTEIKTTFFTTGEVATLYPRLIEEIVENEHELGCHGYAHERFDRLNKQQARNAIFKAKKLLENFDSTVTSFRAPNLKFPHEYIEILQENDFKIDSSIAKYKPPFPLKTRIVGDIVRIPASVTSSFLRLPLSVILPILEHMHDPVLFVHPWEYVDMSQTAIRPDCKFNTGEKALENLAGLITYFKEKGYTFLTISEMAEYNR